jgi:hypothetical protein
MKKMTKQRFVGLALVAISAAILLLASTGKTPEDRDATAVLLTLPLGIYALITKKNILDDGYTETGEEPEKKPEDMCPGCDGKNKLEKGVTLWHENVL